MVAVIFRFMLFLSGIMNGFVTYTPEFKTPVKRCIIEKTVEAPDTVSSNVPNFKPIES